MKEKYFLKGFFTRILTLYNGLWYLCFVLKVVTCMIFSSIQINVVVSGALDRLHSEKDPCVKYDVNRKLWIYLHRSRSEEEFGKAKNVVHGLKTLRYSFCQNDFSIVFVFHYLYCTMKCWLVQIDFITLATCNCKQKCNWFFKFNFNK